MSSIEHPQEALVRPLTELADDERMFQTEVRRFAKEQIAPHVREMDDAGIFRKDLLARIFEFGLMGIEIPEEYGGQGGGFFQSVLAIEEIAAIDPSASVDRRCPEHAGEQRGHALGEFGAEKAVPATTRHRHGRRIRALGGRRRVGRICAHHPSNR